MVRRFLSALIFVATAAFIANAQLGTYGPGTGPSQQGTVPWLVSGTVYTNILSNVSASSAVNTQWWSGSVLGSATTWGVAPTGSNVIAANVNCLAGCSAATGTNITSLQSQNLASPSAFGVVLASSGNVLDVNAAVVNLPLQVNCTIGCSGSSGGGTNITSIQYQNLTSPTAFGALASTSGVVQNVNAAVVNLPLQVNCTVGCAASGGTNITSVQSQNLASPSAFGVLAATSGNVLDINAAIVNNPIVSVSTINANIVNTPTVSVTTVNTVVTSGLTQAQLIASVVTSGNTANYPAGAYAPLTVQQNGSLNAAQPDIKSYSQSLALTPVNTAITATLGQGQDVIAWRIFNLTPSGAVLAIECSVDGGSNWGACNGNNPGAGSTFTTVGIDQNPMLVNAAGMGAVRLRVSTAASATNATISYTASVGSGQTALSQAIPQGSNVIGKVGIDQTTLGSTNGAFVVNSLSSPVNDNLAQLQGQTLASPTAFGVQPTTSGNVANVNAAIVNNPIVSVTTINANVVNTPTVSVTTVNTVVTNTPTVSVSSITSQSALNLTQEAGVTLGANAVTNYGSAPAASPVIGVNAFITNTPTVSFATINTANVNVANTPSINLAQENGTALGTPTNYGLAPTSPTVVIAANAYVTSGSIAVANITTGTVLATVNSSSALNVASIASQNALNLTQQAGTALAAPVPYGDAAGTPNAPPVNAYVTSGVVAIIGNAVPTSAVYQAARATTLSPTTASDGNLVAAIADSMGRLISFPYTNKENHLSVTTSGTTVTSVSFIPAGGGNNFTFITAFECFNQSGSGTGFSLRNGNVTASNDIYAMGLGANTQFGQTFPTPLGGNSLGTNTAVWLNITSAVTKWMCNAQYFLSK